MTNITTAVLNIRGLWKYTIATLWTSCDNIVKSAEWVAFCSLFVCGEVVHIAKILCAPFDAAFWTQVHFYEHVAVAFFFRDLFFVDYNTCTSNSKTNSSTNETQAYVKLNKKHIYLVN
jgi:hypothetical protein